MKEKKLMTIKEVAEALGMPYGSLRPYVTKYRERLLEKGVLVKKITPIRDRYLVCVSPEEFIETLRKVKEEEDERKKQN